MLSANLIPARGLKPLNSLSVNKFFSTLSANLIPARGLKPSTHLGSP